MKSPDVELYEILIAAAESKNLVQAAEKLQISQPAVSMKLKELEEQTPLPLFGYEGKRKILTHYGRELYKIAKINRTRLAGDYEVLNRQYASAETLTLKVGSRRELFESLAPRLRFGGKVLFKPLSSTAALEQLLAHEIDIAITYRVANSANIIAKRVLESTAKLIAPKVLLKSRGASESLIHDKDFLRTTPSVLYQKNGHLLKDWVQHLGVEFADLKPCAVAEDWRSVQTLVSSGWGYAIVPSYIELAENVVAIPLPQSVLPKYTFYALFHRDLKKVPAFKNVLEFKGV